MPDNFLIYNRKIFTEIFHCFNKDPNLTHILMRLHPKCCITKAIVIRSPGNYTHFYPQCLIFFQYIYNFLRIPALAFSLFRESISINYSFIFTNYIINLFPCHWFRNASIEYAIHNINRYSLTKYVIFYFVSISCKNFLTWGQDIIYHTDECIQSIEEAI